MYISYKLNFKGGTQLFYAVGERNAVLEAIRRSFTNHDLKIHSSKDQEFSHFPGGWLDRASCAYVRMHGAKGHQTDHYTISYHCTDHPAVTRVVVTALRKESIFNKNKIGNEIEAFFSGFLEEFARFKIALVGSDDWDRFVAENPGFNCR
ncbi:MAG: hypothetical protein HS117_07780 [Verrucomicrobiaceae bacterium]|nr:hypothetical protein [Verrucomicrobiaceae bacterium]